jgi:RHS repeat-associated protein
MYGWDGDTLAFESSVHRGHAAGERTVHYVYERDRFVPLVQATRSQALQLPPTTDVKALMAGNGGKYEIALDPLWNGECEQEAEPFGKEEIAFYQCDHLGTPQELTDCEGQVAWSAQYKAWGHAQEAISEAARKAGIRNPIRFQGQYFDEETGLHYNRYRYYDPDGARYLTQDPIGLAGGFNLYRYVGNPVNLIDPLGLSCKLPNSANRPLALPAPTASNPWMPNTPMQSAPAPAGGLEIQMAMAPGQTRPGGWGTLDHIPDVAYVRQNLAVTPQFKPAVSHVQTFHIPEGVQLQHGMVGPQKHGCTIYPGGGSQVQILNYADRAKLVPIGAPRPIK